MISGFRRLLSFDRRRGFTLTEIAVVMGIIGVVIAGIWAAAGQAQSSAKTQRATQQVLQIVTSYRKFYAARGVDMADGTDVTCMGINAGFFPPDMVPAGLTCTTSASGVAAYAGTKNLLTPWGGSSTVYVSVTQSIPVIQVMYANLTPAACIQLGAAMSQDPSMVMEAVGQASYAHYVNGYNGVAATPDSVATISYNCTHLTNPAALPFVEVGYAAN